MKNDTQRWKPNIEDEAEHIVITVANIIRAAIRDKVYSSDLYQTNDDISSIEKVGNGYYRTYRHWWKLSFH